jgi:hypothetical protein
MSNRLRRTAAGFAFGLCLALFATPAVSAASAASAAHNTKPSARAPRPASHGLLTALWSHLVGTNPFDPRPTQGPTVDPNGRS